MYSTMMVNICKNVKLSYTYRIRYANKFLHIKAKFWAHCRITNRKILVCSDVPGREFLEAKSFVSSEDDASAFSHLDVPDACRGALVGG